MPLQILSTKLSVPPLRPRLVRRTRLFQKLNQGLEYGLVLVSAPAGYGKSTLLSAWLSQVKISIAWLTLDEGDNDPPRFMAYLATALAGVDPSIKDIFDNSKNIRSQQDVNILLTPLINHLADLKHPFYLVLDDFYLIQDEVVLQVVNFLLEHRPAPMHLVISTRADPPLPLAKLRVRSELLEIRLADLRFTNLEATDFLNRTMGLQISSTDVDTITSRTEGWIAGLQIAALSMQNIEDVSGFIASLAGIDYYIFDYLVKEILARQSPEIQYFLLCTSILDQLTAPLCDAILAGHLESTPIHHSANILQELVHANLFLFPLDYEYRWFRYHQLFSDLLRVILEQTYPDRSVELHRQACLWYERQGMLAEAFHHTLLSGDMQLLAQIASANILALSENDELIPTLKRIDSLPPENLIRLPWLGIARAWIVEAGEVQKTEQLLVDIEKNLEDSLEGSELRSITGHIAAVRSNLSAVRGDWDIAIAQAQQAIELLPAGEVVVRARCLITWGRGLADHQDYSSAIKLLEQAKALAIQAEKPPVIIYAAASLAIAYLFTGGMHDLQRVCLEALEIAQAYQNRFHHPLSATAEIYSLLSRVHAEWGEYEKAIEYAQKGLMLSERWGHDVFISACLLYLGRALAFNNDMEQARTMFQRADNINRKFSPWMWKQGVLFILESLLDGETTYSREIVSLVHQIQDSGVEIPAILKARLLLRQDNPDEALVFLDQASVELKNKSTYNSLRIHALRAIGYQVLGKTEQAFLSLQQALELGESENRVVSFVREGAAMEKLIRLAQAKAIFPQFVQRLLEAFQRRHTIKTQSSNVSEKLAEPLSVREMDILKLLAQGCSDKEIAETLVIARDTVHKHLGNIYSKLDVHTRMEAILRARNLGLL